VNSLQSRKLQNFPQSTWTVRSRTDIVEQDPSIPVAKIHKKIENIFIPFLGHMSGQNLNGEARVAAALIAAQNGFFRVGELPQVLELTVALRSLGVSSFVSAHALYKYRVFVFGRVVKLRLV
jgi:hypothetical protein